MVSQLLLLGVLYTCVVLLSSSPVKGGDAGEAISRLSKSLGALKEDLTGQQAKPDIDVDDVDDKQHIFGSYEDDSSIYHKIVSFRNVYTVPTYIALADYDRVTDDPSTTDRVSRVSTLVADIKKLVEQQEKTEDSAGSSQSQGDAFLEIKRTALKTKSYAQLLAQRTNSTAVLKVISVDAYDMIGEYKKTKCLGRGGFGEVWQFEAPGLDPVVAKFPNVKNQQETIMKGLVEHEYNKMKTEADDECSLARELAYRYPNCFLFMNCFTYRFTKGEEADGSKDEVFVVLESGGPTNLRAALQSSLITDRDAVQILHQLLVAVSKLQELGLTHHDLKPDNIMFRRGEGALVHIKLVDYGAMFKYGGFRRKLVHTKKYAPPEFLSMSETRKEKYDLWACGAMGLEMLFYLLSNTVIELTPVVRGLTKQRAEATLVSGSEEEAKREELLTLALNYALQGLTKEMSEAVASFKNGWAFKKNREHHLHAAKLRAALFKYLDEVKKLPSEEETAAVAMFEKLSLFYHGYFDVIQALLSSDPRDRTGLAELSGNYLFQELLPAEYSRAGSSFYGEASLEGVPRLPDSKAEAILRALKSKEEREKEDLDTVFDELFGDEALGMGVGSMGARIDGGSSHAAASGLGDSDNELRIMGSVKDLLEGGAGDESTSEVVIRLNGEDSSLPSVVEEAGDLEVEAGSRAKTAAEKLMGFEKSQLSSIEL